MPAERSLAVLGVATLLLVGTVGAAWMAWVTIGIDLLLVLAAAVDHRRASLTSLSASRRLPPLLAQGSAADVEVRIETSGARPVTVVARESLHPALAPAPLRTRVELPPEGLVSWQYRMVPRRRGEHVLGPLTVRVLGPWRLAWAERDLIPPERHRVYPQVRWEGRVGQLLALAQRRELGRAPLRFRGFGSEPYALREYLPGDPPHKIHWKATARHGRLVTREDTWERGARLLILLDAARAMASIGEPRQDGQAAFSRSKLDYALAAVLALVRVATARGDRVSVLAFSDRVERLVRVGSSTRGISAAYQALFDLDARLVEPAYDLAAEAALDADSRRATVVLVTSVVDLAATELLRESLLRLERRHRPILVNLEDPELAALAASAPERPEEAFAKVASLEILLANRRLARRLRRSGVRVVTTPADRLTLETLEAYLALFKSRAA